MESKFVKMLLSSCKNKKVAILGHRSADFDCIGSSIAMHMILKQFNISSDIFVESKIDPKLIKIAEGLPVFSETESCYDVCIAVDCATFQLIPENISNIFKNAKTTFVIDHHISNSKYAEHNFVKEASSACEVIFDLFKNKIKLNKELAKALYLGIYTDSGGFKYSNATSNTFLIVSKLLKFDIQPDKLVHDFVDVVSKSDFELTKCYFESSKFYCDNQIVVSLITKEQIDKFAKDGVTPKFMQSYLQNLDGVKIAITISEKIKNEYNISLRTACDNVNVSAIASRFGGGGHIRASGLTLKGNYEKALNALIMECKNQLKGL